MVPLGPTETRPWRSRAPGADVVRRLAGALGLEPIVASVLAARGHAEPESARGFLDPTVDALIDPGLMADMDKGAERLARAVTDGEPVVIYGDYDVDGLTATALLVQYLRFLGVEPEVYVPNRAFEGYSFTEKGVAWCLQRGAKVVVSVDNGTGAVEPIGRLADAGVDVIVTDHHLPGAVLPPAHAVLNPRRRDCPYPFKGLAGVGVAFKLACAAASRLPPARRATSAMGRFLGEAMAWVALGTVADMVPLVGENRILVARGLLAIPKSGSPGLAALCEVSGASSVGFGAEDVAFKLAPRLNAAGRLGQAETSLALLVAKDPDEARRLAHDLDRLNEKRRELDKRIHQLASVEADRLPADEPIVLHDDRWATGLLGLVAGRLAQRLGRPAALISALQGEPAKGSMRSVPGFSAHAALEACDEHLVGHGGHAMAAGFQIETGRVPAFREALVAAWQAHAASGVVPAIEYDGELPLAALTSRVVKQLEQLAPFGQGNPKPVLGALGVTVIEARRMGGDGSHLTLQLGQGPANLRAVAFGSGDLADRLGHGQILDILFSPRINRFRGRESVEIELVDLRDAATGRPPGAERAAPSPSASREEAR